MPQERDGREEMLLAFVSGPETALTFQPDSRPKCNRRGTPSQYLADG
jgi:hypothetical protein